MSATERGENEHFHWMAESATGTPAPTTTAHQPVSGLGAQKKERDEMSTWVGSSSKTMPPVSTTLNSYADHHPGA